MFEFLGEIVAKRLTLLTTSRGGRKTPNKLNAKGNFENRKIKRLDGVCFGPLNLGGLKNQSH